MNCHLRNAVCLKYRIISNMLSSEGEINHRVFSIKMCESMVSDCMRSGIDFLKKEK